MSHKINPKCHVPVVYTETTPQPVQTQTSSSPQAYPKSEVKKELPLLGWQNKALQKILLNSYFLQGKNAVSLGIHLYPLLAYLQSFLLKDLPPKERVDIALIGSAVGHVLDPQVKYNDLDLLIHIQIPIDSKILENKNFAENYIKDQVISHCNRTRTAIESYIARHLNLAENDRGVLAEIANNYISKQSLHNHPINFDDLSHPSDNRCSIVQLDNLEFKTAIDLCVYQGEEVIAVVPGLKYPSAFDRDDMRIYLPPAFLNAQNNVELIPLSVQSSDVNIWDALKQLKAGQLETSLVDGNKCIKGIENITFKGCFYPNDETNRAILTKFLETPNALEKLEKHFGKYKEKHFGRYKEENPSFALLSALSNFMINGANLNVDMTQVEDISAILKEFYPSIPGEFLLKGFELTFFLSSKESKKTTDVVTVTFDNKKYCLLRPKRPGDLLLDFFSLMQKYPNASLKYIPFFGCRFQTEEQLFAQLRSRMKPQEFSSLVRTCIQTYPKSALSLWTWADQEMVFESFPVDELEAYACLQKLEPHLHSLENMLFRLRHASKYLTPENSGQAENFNAELLSLVNQGVGNVKLILNLLNTIAPLPLELRDTIANHCVDALEETNPDILFEVLEALTTVCSQEVAQKHTDKLLCLICALADVGQAKSILSRAVELKILTEEKPDQVVQLYFSVFEKEHNSTAQQISKFVERALQTPLFVKILQAQPLEERVYLLIHHSAQVKGALAAQNLAGLFKQLFAKEGQNVPCEMLLQLLAAATNSTSTPVKQALMRETEQHFEQKGIKVAPLFQHLRTGYTTASAYYLSCIRDLAPLQPEMARKVWSHAMREGIFENAPVHELEAFTCIQGMDQKLTLSKKLDEALFQLSLVSHKLVEQPEVFNAHLLTLVQNLAKTGFVLKDLKRLNDLLADTATLHIHPNIVECIQSTLIAQIKKGKLAHNAVPWVLLLQCELLKVDDQKSLECCYTIIDQWKQEPNECDVPHVLPALSLLKTHLEQGTQVQLQSLKKYSECVRTCLSSKKEVLIQVAEKVLTVGIQSTSPQVNSCVTNLFVDLVGVHANPAALIEKGLEQKILTAETPEALINAYFSALPGCAENALQTPLFVEVLKNHANARIIQLLGHCGKVQSPLAIQNLTGLFAHHCKNIKGKNSEFRVLHVLLNHLPLFSSVAAREALIEQTALFFSEKKVEDHGIFEKLKSNAASPQLSLSALYLTCIQHFCSSSAPQLAKTLCNYAEAEKVFTSSADDEFNAHLCMQELKLSEPLTTAQLIDLFKEMSGYSLKLPPEKAALVKPLLLSMLDKVFQKKYNREDIQSLSKTMSSMNSLPNIASSLKTKLTHAVAQKMKQGSLEESTQWFALLNKEKLLRANEPESQGCCTTLLSQWEEKPSTQSFSKIQPAFQLMLNTENSTGYVHLVNGCLKSQKPELIQEAEPLILAGMKGLCPLKNAELFCELLALQKETKQVEALFIKGLNQKVLHQKTPESLLKALRMALKDIPEPLMIFFISSGTGSGEPSPIKPSPFAEQILKNRSVIDVLLDSKTENSNPIILQLLNCSTLIRSVDASKNLVSLFKQLYKNRKSIQDDSLDEKIYGSTVLLLNNLSGNNNLDYDQWLELISELETDEIIFKDRSYELKLVNNLILSRMFDRISIFIEENRAKQRNKCLELAKFYEKCETLPLLEDDFGRLQGIHFAVLSRLGCKQELLSKIDSQPLERRLPVIEYTLYIDIREAKERILFNEEELQQILKLLEECCEQLPSSKLTFFEERSLDVIKKCATTADSPILSRMLEILLKLYPAHEGRFKDMKGLFDAALKRQVELPFGKNLEKEPEKVIQVFSQFEKYPLHHDRFLVYQKLYLNALYVYGQSEKLVTTLQSMQPQRRFEAIQQLLIIFIDLQRNELRPSESGIEQLLYMFDNCCKEYPLIKECTLDIFEPEINALLVKSKPPVDSAVVDMALNVMIRLFRTHPEKFKDCEKTNNCCIETSFKFAYNHYAFLFIEFSNKKKLNNADFKTVAKLALNNGSLTFIPEVGKSFLIEKEISYSEEELLCRHIESQTQIEHIESLIIQGLNQKVFNQTTPRQIERALCVALNGKPGQNSPHFLETILQDPSAIYALTPSATNDLVLKLLNCSHQIKSPEAFKGLITLFHVLYECRKVKSDHTLDDQIFVSTIALFRNLKEAQGIDYIQWLRALHVLEKDTIIFKDHTDDAKNFAYIALNQVMLQLTDFMSKSFSNKKLTDTILKLRPVFEKYESVPLHPSHYLHMQNLHLAYLFGNKLDSFSKLKSMDVERRFGALQQMFCVLFDYENMNERASTDEYEQVYAMLDACIQEHPSKETLKLTVFEELLPELMNRYVEGREQFIAPKAMDVLKKLYQSYPDRFTDVKTLFNLVFKAQINQPLNLILTVELDAIVATPILNLIGSYETLPLHPKDFLSHQNLHLSVLAANGRANEVVKRLEKMDSARRFNAIQQAIVAFLKLQDTKYRVEDFQWDLIVLMLTNHLKEHPSKLTILEPLVKELLDQSDASNNLVVARTLGVLNTLFNTHPEAFEDIGDLCRHIVDVSIRCNHMAFAIGFLDLSYKNGHISAEEYENLQNSYPILQKFSQQAGSNNNEKTGPIF